MNDPTSFCPKHGKKYPLYVGCLECDAEYEKESEMTKCIKDGWGGRCPGCDGVACVKPAEPTVFEAAKPPRKHAHYFKPCPYAEVDVYRVLKLFDVTDQCIGHALKKLLVAGGRGAGKDVSKDVQEAIDSLLRWQEMRAEEATPPQR